MRYKVGDKVQVRGDLIKGCMYGCEEYDGSADQLLGRECTISYVFEDGYNLSEESLGCSVIWTDEMFVRQYISFDNCKVGDELITAVGGRKTVIARCGSIVALSYSSKMSLDGWYTKEECDKCGFKFVQPKEDKKETINIGGKDYIVTDELKKQLSDLEEA